jgi:hypothetical protein
MLRSVKVLVQSQLKLTKLQLSLEAWVEEISNWKCVEKWQLLLTHHKVFLLDILMGSSLTSLTCLTAFSVCRHVNTVKSVYGATKNHPTYTGGQLIENLIFYMTTYIHSYNNYPNRIIVLHTSTDHL